VEVTELLVKWDEGDKGALDELIPLVYEELRRLAGFYIRRDRRVYSLEPTGLVNEVYIRLVGRQSIGFRNRAQFFGLAAKVMRNILVDQARRGQAHKRGGSYLRVSLDRADRVTPRSDVDIVALDDALSKLEIIKPEHSRIVELRFFGGLTIEETAEVMGVSHATVERGWSFARSWLRRELNA
jgi:RNA polymerase sigma factor (TIGR02999 family)